jgi:hypothetical protein
MTYTPKTYTLKEPPPDGILYNNDHFIGVNEKAADYLSASPTTIHHRGEYHPTYNPEWPLLTVCGDNVVIENVILKPQSPSNFIAISLGGNNCIIRNALIDWHETNPQTHEGWHFGIGIDMPTINQNFPGYIDYRKQTGNTLEHVRMNGVRTGVKLRIWDNSNIQGQYNSLTMHDVGIRLADISESNAGIEISENCTLNGANIIANTWFNGAARYASGFRIKGKIANSFIKYTTERLTDMGQPNWNDPNGSGIKIENPNWNGGGNNIFHYTQCDRQYSVPFVVQNPAGLPLLSLEIDGTPTAGISWKHSYFP